ncbi:MAG: MBL fold metallo-hydrolase [Synergistaceae bacterium]|nr:MBL fold metallo-hydrolase [Synergistaceae bacterium]
MEIKAVKFYEDGFMTQPFAFGGGDEASQYDASVRYPSSLQNFLIDMGNEVILVDTGFSKEMKDAEPNEKTQIYVGKRIQDYMAAFAAMGYKPEQVTKILVTHKHPDHTGVIRAFPNAKIYIGPEDADALKLEGENIVRAAYSDGPYHNFPRSQKIAEGVYFIEAKGHTKGNSIIIAEKDGLFYMMHGDVTYTDAALKEDKLSVVFEDLDAARDTLTKVREFIRANPTVYLSTHTPEGWQNLENKTVMKLD